MPNDTVTYDAGLAGTAILEAPTITVTHTTLISEYRKFTVLVRIVYTVRSVIAAPSAILLNELMEGFRTVLSVSGGTLRVNYGGKSDFLSAGPDVDVSGGPHPTLLNIQKLHGAKAAVITWQLQTEKQVADDAYNPVGAWLDFVYTVSTTIDRNFYATRTIAGLLRLSSCHRDTRYRSADAFRDTVEHNIAALPAQGPWQRVNRDFRLSEDGKILAFSIIDKQMYTSLPPGVTGGDLFITTVIEKDMKGRFTLRGWFEGHPNLQRGEVNDFVAALWQSFYQETLVRLNAETGGELCFINQRRKITSAWRSNRIEFEATWSIEGQFYPGMSDNTMLCVSRGLQWLALMSRTFSAPITNLGPGGSAPVLGPLGTEAPGPIIAIDPMSKLPEGWSLGIPVIPPYGEGDRTDRAAGSSTTRQHTSWHQHFEYKYKSGRIFIPVLKANLCDIVQQAKNPELFLTVSGEARSTVSIPEIPYHPYILLEEAVEGDEIDGVPRVILVEHTVMPSSISAADEYRVAWRYVYKFHGIGSKIPYKWPYTPENLELSETPFVVPVDE